jgi:hypothetical protein
MTPNDTEFCGVGAFRASHAKPEIMILGFPEQPPADPYGPGYEALGRPFGNRLGANPVNFGQLLNRQALNTINFHGRHNCPLRTL